MADDATSKISNESQIKATEEPCGATLQIITSNLSLLSNSDDAACNINKDRSNTMGGTFDIIMSKIKECSNLLCVSQDWFNTHGTIRIT